MTDLGQRVCVEFVGMPGSGKSTIASSLISKLRDRGCSCPGMERMKLVKNAGPQAKVSYWPTPFGRISVRSKVLDLVLLAIRLPTGFFWAFLYFFSVRPFNLASLRVCRRLLNWLRLYAGWEKTNPCDCIVFDDALLQTAMALAWEGEVYSEQALENLLKFLLATVDVKFIFTKIDSSTALERIALRAEEERAGLKGIPYNWRFFYDSGLIQQKKLNQAEKFFQQAAIVLQRLRPDLVMVVDAHEDVEINSEKIINFILSHV